MKPLAWVAATAACIIAGAWVVGGPRAPAGEVEQGLRIKAMTFNIRLSRAHDGANAWPHRRELVVEVIRGFAGDFVGLQEAWPEQIAYLAQSLPQYRYIGRSRERDGVEGEAIPLFYRHERWSLDPHEQGTFWLSDTPEVPGSTSWGNQIPRVVTWGDSPRRAAAGQCTCTTCTWIICRLLRGCEVPGPWPNASPAGPIPSRYWCWGISMPANLPNRCGI